MRPDHPLGLRVYGRIQRPFTGTSSFSIVLRGQSAVWNLQQLLFRRQVIFYTIKAGGLFYPSAFCCHKQEIRAS
jgi:hypothetical protein